MNTQKFHRLWITLALLICTCLAATSAIPHTLAYMQQESNTLRNKINIIYTPPADITVPVQVHKVIRSLGEETILPADFVFTLRGLNNDSLITLVTDETGYADAALTFTAADIGKTYHYELTETPGADKRITYSDKVYAVRVTLTLDMFNCIRADIHVGDVRADFISAEFENVFDPFLLPDTGDHDLPLLSAALLILSAAGLLLLRKRRSSSAF